MSTFNRVVNKVRDTAGKVGEKVVGIGDSAAAVIRTKKLEMRIDEQYENLGRIVYRDLHTEEDLEEKKLEIIAAIDAMFDELAELKAAKTKQADEACDCAEEAEVAEEATAEEATAEEAEAPAEEA